MKKNVFLKRLLLAAMMGAPFTVSAQVTIGSGDLPQATLDIIGDTLTAHGEAFRMIDGNQAPGKVLTCDENGIGSWQKGGISILQTSLTGVSPAENQQTFPFADYPNLTAAYVDSLAYIDLEPGNYMILIQVPIRFSFPLEAFERLNYSVGFVKEGSSTYTMQRIHTVDGTLRQNNFIRQIQMAVLDTSSDTSTTRYYVFYSQFQFYNANNLMIAGKEGNVTINLSGHSQSVFFIPLSQ